MKLPTILASSYGWATASEYVGYGEDDWAVCIIHEHGEEPKLIVWLEVPDTAMDSTDCNSFRQYSVTLSRLACSSGKDPILHALQMLDTVADLFRGTHASHGLRLPSWDRCLVRQFNFERIV